MRALALLLIADVARAEPSRAAGGAAAGGAAAGGAAAGRAAACDDAIVDPIATPIRETDQQRGACLRDELAVALTTHALVDTPNFHGVIGGDLALTGRFVIGRLELDARLRVVDYTYVQTAVNKVTATRFGPLAAGGAVAIDPNLALVALVEVPYTRDEMDTLHTSGHAHAAFTTSVARQISVHARFGGGFSYATSAGGDTHRFALRAGTDLVWYPGRRFAVQLGTDTEAGWRGGFSTLLARGGVAIRVGQQRIVVGLGIPLFGDEPTTAVVTIGVARDLNAVARETRRATLAP